MPQINGFGSTAVDNVTIETNESGQLQIKNGAVSEDILDTSLSDKVNNSPILLFNGAISGTSSISFGATYDRIKIFIVNKASSTTGQVTIAPNNLTYRWTKLQNGSVATGDSSIPVELGTDGSGSPALKVGAYLEFNLVGGTLVLHGQSNEYNGSHRFENYSGVSNSVSETGISSLNYAVSNASLTIKVIGYNDA